MKAGFDPLIFFVAQFGQPVQVLHDLRIVIALQSGDQCMADFVTLKPQVIVGIIFHINQLVVLDNRL